jgi:serine/threonine-protein kinase
MVQTALLPTSDAPSDVTDYTPELLIGEKYRLRRFLGEGSQGSVWLAENVALSADVAVKIVHADPSNPAPTLRLEKEARVAARLAHPGVVRVFDLGRTARGDAFIVMEFLTGENLGERLTTSGRLSPLEAVRTLLPIADVLHVAHEAGIVHRDLKPENVFLARNGSTVQPKLLDFGIAKRRPATGSTEPVITDLGAIVGSPAYISPEQAVGRGDIGQAADIWSFCVVLYECLTGQLPFAADDYRELFRQIDEEPPRPIFVHGVADVELWAIVRRGLAKVPAERWPDMQSLGRALAVWLKARGVEDDISGMRLDSRWLWRARAESAAPVCAAEPRPFVRPVPLKEPAPQGNVTSRRAERRAASRLVLGAALVTAGTLALGSAWWALGADRAPGGHATDVEVSPPSPEPRAPAAVLGDISAATVASRVTPAASTVPVANRPQPSQRATPATTRSSVPPPVARSGGGGTEPASTGKRRPPPKFDLIEPY